jgi:hypothetical protein
MAAPDVALSELARVVQPSGLVIVQVWTAGGLLVPHLFREAAASVGVELVDPNAALGRVNLLTAAFETAGLTDIDVKNATWQEPLPVPDDAWEGVVASAVGGPLRALDPDRQHSARQHFCNAMATELERRSTDLQPLLIATGARRA